MTDHLVIMAAGQGTRMGPLTATRPKVMLPVAGKPVLEHMVERGRAAGFTRVTLVVHAMADQIKSHFGETVEYVDQGVPKGTGHAVAALAGHVAEDFVLASGDSIVSVDDLVNLRAASGHVVGAAQVDDVRAYGHLDVEGGAVQGVAEKPTERMAGWANTGTYRFTPDIIARCKALAPSPRGELELTDAITGLATDGAPAALLELGQWLEAGRPWDLLDMQAALMDGMDGQDIRGDVSKHTEIEGPVVIEEGARVTGATRIEGPVIIQRGATIGPNAYLRPNTVIGAGCHIGNHSEVKGSIVMAGSNVPHLSYVGDSVIGPDCNLGAGTQVANLKTNGRDVRVHWNGADWMDTGRRKLGCILGDGVKTGVNASLMPGLVAEGGAQLAAGTVHAGWAVS